VSPSPPSKLDRNLACPSRKKLRFSKTPIIKSEGDGDTIIMVERPYLAQVAKPQVKACRCEEGKYIEPIWKGRLPQNAVWSEEKGIYLRQLPNMMREKWINMTDTEMETIQTDIRFNYAAELSLVTLESLPSLPPDAICREFCLATTKCCATLLISHHIKEPEFCWNFKSMSDNVAKTITTEIKLSSPMVFNVSSQTLVPVPTHSLCRIVYPRSSITLRTIGGERTVQTEQEGFSFRAIMSAIELVERSTRPSSELCGAPDYLNIFYEGLKKSADGRGFDVQWGS